MNRRLKRGDRVMVPRSSGKKTPGEIVEIYGNGWAKVKLDTRGNRGQALGKNTPIDELEKIQ